MCVCAREGLFVFQCGPAMNWQLVQGVIPPSPEESWDRLQHPRPANRSTDESVMDRFMMIHDEFVHSDEWVSSFVIRIFLVKSL